MRARLFKLTISGLVVATVLVIAIWIRSYISVDWFTYIYYRSRGTLVEGKTILHLGSTAAWEIGVFDGSILITKPYVDGGPYGLHYSTQPAAELRPRMAQFKHRTFLGFYASRGEMIAPLWPIAYAVAVIPSLYFYRRFRQRVRRGLAVE